MPSSIIRKCTACGKTDDRSQFIRILTDFKTGKAIITPSSKQFGRSTYLCKNPECLKLAIKKKRFKNLSETQIQQLEELCK